MKSIRALIVQGFPEIRAALREMVATEKDLLLVGECADGASAATAIRKHRPQLLFLGVRLRGMNGFEFLKFLDDEVPPAVIFVSPFDYAAGAFGVHAVDYLLKPFTPQRFKQAVQRARARLQSGPGQSTVKSSDAAGYAKPISIKKDGRIVLIKPHEIDTIVAQRTYSILHAAGTSYRVRSSLSNLQRMLPPGKLLRISRSTLVNPKRIEQIVRKSHGDGVVRLANGQEFPLSRRYRAQWSALLSAK